ncbi:hypothetical protein QWI17_10310 [Gilvimarinus sp. SDUM040013]|uniref:Twin-arginine translocation pathway signal protein n=1 Tax=Gilvimarinus gilvus TaxID=3058038 RepID=A0ABU4RXY8_9GAMM|nr:hypothetical protein [Gilvimarinus sp. SDUM040013]MDO3386230.1 hypothetical protein [Gilvimarinus sp. SDUM040013]MDX6849775.1 hypothetical protein [Gilvimarinus sp. SDUM040013]
MNRRAFLKGAGAAIVISGIPTAVWMNTRTPHKALEPWKQAAIGFGDARIDALAYALLAPNPHNRQPWEVKLVGDDTIDLHCRLDRRLPYTDPYDRQILIGLGCFTELLVVAAASKGYQCNVTPFPDGEPHPRLDGRCVARFTLRKGTPKTDPLFNHVFERRSIKETFDATKKVSQAQLDELVSSEPSAAGTVNPSQTGRINQMAYDAMKIEFLTPRTLRESTDLMRFGKAQIEAQPDGIDIGGAGMELLHKVGLLTRDNFSDAEGAMVKDYLASLEPRYTSTVGYLWQTTPGNTRAEQFQVGREYVRLNLKATQMGLSMHPVSQILQEYPEMDTLYAQMHDAVGVSQPARLQMLARIGYGPKVAETPRWPVETILSQV